LGTLNKARFLIGFPSDQWSPHKRTKLEQWIDKQDENFRPDYFIALKSIPREIRKWIPKDRIHKWSEPDAEKVVREKTVGSTWNSRPSGSYEGYVGGVYQRVIEAADIIPKNGVFYYAKSEGAAGKNVVEALNPDATVVSLGLNRVAKFKRDFPGAKRCYDYAKEQAVIWAKKLTHEDKLYLTIHGNRECQTLSNFNPAEIDDPDFEEAVRVCKSDRKALKAKRDMFGTLLHDQKLTVEWEDPIEKYPLLTRRGYYDILSGDSMEHAVIYINAAYAAEREDEADA
jgi:hypothetical protein